MKKTKTKTVWWSMLLEWTTPTQILTDSRHSTKHRKIYNSKTEKHWTCEMAWMGVLRDTDKIGLFVSKDSPFFSSAH